MRGHRIALTSAATALLLAVAGCSTGDPGDAGAAPAEPVPSVSKVDDLARLVPPEYAKKGTVTLGVNVDIAPLKYIDDSGKVTGFSIDQFELASTLLGLKVQVEQGSFDSLIPGVKADRYDALASLADVTEREDSIRFVDFLRAGVSWVSAKDTPVAVRSREDLCGHSVAVLKGSGAETEMAQQATKCASSPAGPLKVAGYNDSNAALLAVDSGEDELAMIDSPAATYNVNAFPDKYTLAYTEYTNPNGIGFPKDQPQLANAYAAALKYLDQHGQYAALARRYKVEPKDLLTDFPIDQGPKLKGVAG